MNRSPNPVHGIRVGTSGWNYDSWLGRFYPEATAEQAMLAVYSRHFSTVELNNSFYQLPRETAVKDWVSRVPRDFLFSVKASRYLTHMKKLREPGEGLDRFLAAIAPFGRHLGPVLFQLPPNWRVNAGRLETFLQRLPSGYRYAFEFRDRSWLNGDVYALLEAHNAALCIYDLEGYRSPRKVTADFVYVRLHGPGEVAYQGSYDGRTLAGLVRQFLRWRDEGREVFCYFDNDDKACAPEDGRRLLGSLARQARSR